MRRVFVDADCAPRFGCGVTLWYAESWTDWLRLLLGGGRWHSDGFGRLCKLTLGTEGL